LLLIRLYGEGWVFVTYTAASHKGAIEMFWLHFSGRVAHLVQTVWCDLLHYCSSGKIINLLWTVWGLIT